MKMYYFDPQGYGDEFFVMAKNKDEAIKYVLKHLKENFNHVNYGDFYREKYEAIKTGKTHSIKEYGEGDVIESEIS